MPNESDERESMQRGTMHPIREEQSPSGHTERGHVGEVSPISTPRVHGKAGDLPLLAATRGSENGRTGRVLLPSQFQCQFESAGSRGDGSVKVDWVHFASKDMVDRKKRLEISAATTFVQTAAIQRRRQGT